MAMTTTHSIQVSGCLRDPDQEVAFILNMSGCRYGGAILVKPSSLNLELAEEDAIDVGVSSIEAEAEGIDAFTACERLNKHFGNHFVQVDSYREFLAIQRLFDHADADVGFNLSVKKSIKQAS